MKKLHLVLYALTLAGSVAAAAMQPDPQWQGESTDHPAGGLVPVIDLSNLG